MPPPPLPLDPALAGPHHQLQANSHSPASAQYGYNPIFNQQPQQPVQSRSAQMQYPMNQSSQFTQSQEGDDSDEDEEASEEEQPTTGKGGKGGKKRPAAKTAGGSASKKAKQLAENDDDEDDESPAPANGTQPKPKSTRGSKYVCVVFPFLDVWLLTNHLAGRVLIVDASK